MTDGAPPAGPAPGPGETRSAERTLVLLGVFALGFVLVFAGAVLLVRRARRHARPVAPPVIELRLEVAAGGSASLVFTNVSPAPREVILPCGPRTGPEIDVLLDSGDAERLEGPIQTVAPATTVLLAPGESVRQDLPLAEYLTLRGRATIHVERAKLRADEPRLRSNSAAVSNKP